MGRIIAVLNQKGGVGKTTSTINIGAYLAKRGKKVLLVDLDPQGNATSGVGIDKQTLDSTVYDTLFGNAKSEQIIKDTAVAGLHILPANAQLAAAEVDLAGELQREYKLRNAIAHLEYDYILIDCPPSLGLLSINAMSAANYILVPVQAEYYALEGLGQLLDVMQRVRQGLNPQLELLGIVVTMHDSRTSLSDQVVDELKKHFKDKLMKTIVPRNVRLAEAPSFGKSIMEHDKWSKGARSYKSLAKEVEDRVGK
ncbi:ParA family protein [Candidatus Saccharibacteria bacterium]|nr:MAG: ParA family protein [Candidatus Saccharibacteria bacterium]